jgi:phosphoglycolate phosphatase
MFSFVVFDLDGTLIDSIGDLVVAVNALVSEHGGRPLAGEQVAKMVGEGANLLIARAFEASGATADAARALPRFLEIYDGVLPGQTKPYPGIRQMLEELAASVPLAVLTNKPAGATRKILSLLAMDAFFVEVVGGDGPFARKPDPEGLVHLMSRVGARPGATLMVGDSTVDLLTARAAGARACIARYGFGYETLATAELAGDEFFVDVPGEVLGLLARG